MKPSTRNIRKAFHQPKAPEPETRQEPTQPLMPNRTFDTMRNILDKRFSRKS